MQYFITLSIHQNFNPCINPTSLMHMPIPTGTFHSMSRITKTYIHRYIHTYTLSIPLWFVKQSVFFPLILLPSFSIWQANIIWSVADLVWYNSDYWQQFACIWCSLWGKNGNKSVCIVKPKNTLTISTLTTLITNRYCNTMLRHCTVKIHNMYLITASFTSWIF